VIACSNGGVPWCDACDRFLSPSTVKVDGTCPSCGRVVEPGHAHALHEGDDAASPSTTTAHRGHTADHDDEEDLPPIPWHLWLLAAALAVYLGYRAMQGIEWLVGVIVVFPR
jgi:hypothetical protein